MRTLATFVLLAALVSCCASRPVDTEKAAATGTASASATNITAPPKPAAVTPKRTCSWFGATCAEKLYTLHCRCRSGCRRNLQFQLAKHISNFSYCSNRVYNKGDWCTRTSSLNFDGKVTYSALGNFYSNGSRYYTKDSMTITLKC